MKKILVVVAVLALVVWVVSWFRTPEIVQTSGARPWPGGLGPLDAAEAKFPPRDANDAARKLAELGRALPKNEAVSEFVRQEVTSGELTIGTPPPIPDASPMRDLLLREEVVWSRHEGIGGGDDDNEMRVLRLTIARTLVASALAKAREGNAAAWDDLHAAWKLARSLEGEPQMMSRTAAMTMARTVNGVAWKMPLPAPAWLAELQAHDYVPTLLESFHYQAADYWDDGAQLFPTKFLADSVENDRGIAEALVAETKCDATFAMNGLGTDLRSVWRRAFRYRAEREATANALLARESKPIEQKSVCSDGSWSFDGTAVRFSRDIATGPPDTPMPLVLRVGPGEGGSSQPGS